MAEDLQTYKLQLQQVEAALTTDPENEELLKLKTDLEEVIELTQDLIRTQQSETREGEQYEDDEDNEFQEEEEYSPEETETPKRLWKVGDKCMAIWGRDGQYYEAIINEITKDGDEVSVTFDGYKSPEVTKLSLIKEVKPGIKRSADEEEDGKNKRVSLSKQREYQKKRKQKKLMRFKQIEEEREGEKNKWLSFKTKVSKKGLTRKSIFASPDNVNGRVGIGTCGMSGKPMTEYSAAEKWRKGT